MRIRRFIIIALLVGWVAFNPVTIVFGGCLGIGAPCHGPCLLMPYAILPATVPVVPPAVMPIPHESPAFCPTPVFKVPTQPPEPSFPSLS